MVSDQANTLIQLTTGWTGDFDYYSSDTSRMTTEVLLIEKAPFNFVTAYTIQGNISGATGGALFVRNLGPGNVTVPSGTMTSYVGHRKF